MEKLNLIMEKMSPGILPLLQLLIICVESFFTNVYVAGKCLFTYLNTYSLQDLSLKNYNKIINDEIDRQHNPVLSNIGVWVSLLFCTNVAWTVLEILTIPILGVVLWWVFIWSVGFGLKEKIGGNFLAKLKMA